MNWWLVLGLWALIALPLMFVAAQWIAYRAKMDFHDEETEHEITDHDKPE